MRRFSMVIVLSGCVASFVGCGQTNGPAASASRGGMAVVDLDKVAAETGRDRQLAQSLELAQNSLNQSYLKTVESAKEQLNAKKKANGSAPTEEEQKEFSNMERSALNQLTQIQNKARAEFEQYKQVQIAKFRAELKPITQDIAAKRGLSIVIPKNEGLLLSVDPGVDITDEVVKVLREKHPVAPIPQAAAPQAAPQEPAAAPESISTRASRRSAAAKSAAASKANQEFEDEESTR
jgi:Skp family chaperone for outer membrane proteins